MLFKIVIFRFKVCFWVWKYPVQFAISLCRDSGFLLVWKSLKTCCDYGSLVVDIYCLFTAGKGASVLWFNIHELFFSGAVSRSFVQGPDLCLPAASYGTFRGQHLSACTLIRRVVSFSNFKKYHSWWKTF